MKIDFDGLHIPSMNTRISKKVLVGIFVVIIFQAQIAYQLYIHGSCYIVPEVISFEEEDWSLVMTFGIVPRQFDRLMENLDVWKDLPPCNRDERSDFRFGLHFVIHTTWDEHESARVRFREFFNNNPLINDCFDEISFISADTRQEENKDHWKRDFPSAKGPNSMFMSGIKEAQKSKYTYMMWMEADAFPVKKHWLDHLISTTTRIPTFMIRGSPPIVESNPIMMEGIPTWPTSARLHISGCALYAITSTTFQVIEESFARRGMDYPWDVMLYEEVFGSYYYTSYQKLLPMYQYSYFVQNRHSDTSSMDKILSGHPDTIFVHHPWCFPDQGQCPEPKLEQPPAFRDLLGLKKPV
eukprot:TRINITY_DN921_c0_g2_i1.p1 TRINITY_DN921_c0_g2~~TRINITY_DN921_c0_g2_i1.p1  ORF type:complete len:374 (-),score=45.43 TRINITY_DN921_c0_g2_i1:75-1136(-)